ncbi:MAG: putative mycofactocin-associated electron transfer flavoprotein [Actinomycetia bacterium]|nr:putative mycofactocin-associated electron transfer flavoprotein [Actinomycetes bacterium]
MTVLVCLKWVALRPEVDPASGQVLTDDRFSGISPADRSALEWALRLSGGTDSIVAVCVGPPAAESTLRDALAVGASDAIRVDVSTELSSSAVGSELAAVVAGLGPSHDIELVCAGNHSLDRGSGSVPAFLANELGWSQALGLVSIESSGAPLTVERRLDRGRRERLAVEGPTVLSFERGPELRRASLGGALAAKSATVVVTDANHRPGSASNPNDQGLRVIGRGPFRPPTNVQPAPTGSTHERLVALSGAGLAPTASAQVQRVSPAEAAQLALERLQEWGYVSATSSADDAGLG